MMMIMMMTKMQNWVKCATFDGFSHRKMKFGKKEHIIHAVVRVKNSRWSLRGEKPPKFKTPNV